MMIFVLIAGSYTPFLLVALTGFWRWGMLIGIWGIAISGIIFKAFWLNAPRWLYTAVYLVMGWLALIVIVPLVRALPTGAIVWLFLGGLSYTVGAVFYALKWPNPVPKVFGFHEIWHIFVMLGSFSHFWSVFRYVTYIN
jgi:hemolysin III